MPVCVPAGQKVLITEDLEDLEVQEGSSATFCCRISPADYKPVHWFLDKTPLSANELNEIEVQPGGYHVLTLRQLTLKDSGTIHFEAGDQRTSAALQVAGRLRAQCPVPWWGPVCVTKHATSRQWLGHTLGEALRLTEKAPWTSHGLGPWIPGSGAWEAEWRYFKTRCCTWYAEVNARSV